MSDQALSVEDAAQRFSVGPRTVWKWIRTGVLPSVRLGNSVRVSERLIDDVLSGRFVLLSRMYDKDTHENPQRLREYRQLFSEFSGYLEAGEIVPADLWHRVVDTALGRWTKQGQMTADEEAGFINVSKRAVAEAERLLHALDEAP